MKKNILLVDDDETITSSLGILLELNGYDVITAQNGEAALKVFNEEKDASNPLSLIITDINMPVMGGVKLVEEVQKISRDIPILLLTGHSSPEEREKLNRLNVAGVIVKPSLPEEITGKINTILSKEETMSLNPLEKASS